MRRLRLSISGAVQGVGFRPFIYRLATDSSLRGWVRNTPGGVLLEVEGEMELLEGFRRAVETRCPSLAMITGIEESWLEPAGFSDFSIQTSTSGTPEALVLPDLATCPDCLGEIMDPADRRYGYPFTNCTNCGPRYSIIRGLPYDRAATTMSGFQMCRQCLGEYRDPLDRRFHAQPNACPVCGPSLSLWDPSGKIIAHRGEALQSAAEAIRNGSVVAVKGLGGFHLMVPASSGSAISELRKRKRRNRKPFAVMFPDLASIRRECRVSETEALLLGSPESPIVLLERSAGRGTGGSHWDMIAPGNPDIGAMLPYTPLHHLLMSTLGEPVVATSGNLSDEPICTDEREALTRLSGIADIFLVHDRPILRHVDDSIVRVIDGRPVILRRARGYAPLPLMLDREITDMLAFGGHLKNTLALSRGRRIFVSQHIGDLETPQAMGAFDEVMESMDDLYRVSPVKIVHDMHPDYISTARARNSGTPATAVQHHLAHIAACMLDNGAHPPLLGVSWDGTGYGPDGTVWGGEFFHVTGGGCIRIGHLRTFGLPGGSRAVKEPRRSAAGLLHRIGLDPVSQLPSDTFTDDEERGLRAILRTGTNLPVTSSVGRLFDAVASICGLFQVIEYEGEAAMALEHALPDTFDPSSYPAPVEGDVRSGLVMDWEPMARELLEDLSRGVPVSTVSGKFHNALVSWIVAVAETLGERRVALSGGCFQNTYLVRESAAALRRRGFVPVLHGALPPNDGGIAPGQIFAAACLPPLVDGS